MRNAGLDEAQAAIKIARRNINNLRYADDTTFMTESKEELKSFLMKVKEENENDFKWQELRELRFPGGWCLLRLDRQIWNSL